MKYPKDDQLLAALLERDDILSVKDFMDAFGDIPIGSVYARIRQMTQSRALSVVGKGKYLATAKPAYRTEVSIKMKECNDVMISNLEGVNCCISERNGNLEVEVSWSADGKTWTEPAAFSWTRDPSAKSFDFGGAQVRFVRIDVTKATGDFGSGRELLLYRVPGTGSYRGGVFNEKGEAVESL